MSKDVGIVSINSIDKPLETLKKIYCEKNDFHKKITDYGNTGKDSAEDEDEDEDELYDELSAIFFKYLTPRKKYTQHELCLIDNFEYDFSKINVSWHKVDEVKAIIEVQEMIGHNQKIKYLLLKTGDEWRIDTCEVFNELKRYWIRTYI